MGGLVLKSRPVILGVDEISKLMDDALIDRTLSALGARQDEDEAFVAVVTSLDYWKEPQERPSGRSYRWIALPRLSLHDLLTKNDFLHLLDNRETALFLSDLGGHPRSLDETVDFLTKNPTTNFTYEQLESALTKSVRLNFARYLSRMSVRRLVPCLLGRSLHPDGEIEGMSFRELAGAGTYLNSLSSDDHQIPFTSIVFLRAFCNDAIQRRRLAFSPTTNVEDNILDLLNKFVNVHRTQDSGSRFEELVSLREAIVRACFAYQGLNTASLADLYGFYDVTKPNDPLTGQISPDWNPKDVTVKIAAPVAVQQLTHKIPPLPSPVSPFPLNQVVFRCTHNQPGLDVITLHPESTKDEYVACSVECRFASVNATKPTELKSTTMKDAEVLQKWKDSNTVYSECCTIGTFAL